jgi:hypothetical protein
MSAMHPARFRGPAGGMVPSEAIEIVQHPVFGDERSIEARRLLVLAERVRNARGWSNWGSGYACDEQFPRIDLMNASELVSELRQWKQAGYDDGGEL